MKGVTMSNEVLSLKHVMRQLPCGSKVFVLNTGALIGPEAEAMLQALHSRSTGGLESHLKKLAVKGPEKFMSQFYVGYGHKSIGDCGSATVFIEGVSMLVAKAVQDWPLYSGQESSTRFIDFSTQDFIDPLNCENGREILEAWRSFYLRGIGLLPADLMKRFPREADEKEELYEKAIMARAFDIMRGFLPAGASTNLAWHGNLRQFADKLLVLRHHQLEEVGDIARAIEEVLKEAFPSSFSGQRYSATEVYNGMCAWHYNYLAADEWPEFELAKDGIDRTLLREYGAALRQRPAKTELPKQIAECGTMQFKFMLDFGSFRDIQRHRAVVQRMPLLNTVHGLNKWYLSELPDEFRAEAIKFLAGQKEKIDILRCSPEIAQYYTAMGYNLPNRLTGNLHALVYLAELRATRFVHPTLSKIASQMAEVLLRKLNKYGLVLHLDSDPGRFDVKRGEHDIVEH